MKKSPHLIAAVAVCAAVVPVALSSSGAEANAGATRAGLAPVVLNGVPGGGAAWVSVHGTNIDVSMAASGLLANQPHAAHIHFGATARHECPAATDDSNANGHLSTSEGGPAYGAVVVSLTKTGDTSPASGLAVDRFDTAPGGNLSYERGHVKVSQTVARAITAGQAVIVVHGVDYNHSGAYDFSAGNSDLNPSLPAEATDPALCGVLVPQK